MLFDEVTRQRALTRLHTGAALRRAIEREEFRVFFQSEVSVETGAIVGPDAFIALAEETGLIVPIGTWVLHEACRVARGWQATRAAGEPLVVRVNVSARQLAQDDLIEIVADAVQRSGMEPEHLCLEVTESVLVEDPEASARKLGELKPLGGIPLQPPRAARCRRAPAALGSRSWTSKA